MKKVIYLMAVLLISSVGLYAQKSNVKIAKSKSSSIENPDFATAREAIKLALQDETTKNDAETWYVAGMIGYNEYQYLMTKAQENLQQPDPMAIAKAVAESYDYFIVADSLSLIPNAKGKVNTKIHRECSEKLLEYYQRQLLVNGGITANNDLQDYQTAYDMFDKHQSIPLLKMMQEPKLQEQMPLDTNYYAYSSYQAAFAMKLGDHDKVIAIYENIKDKGYKPLAIREWLVQEYIEVKDTVNMLKTINESIEKFPTDPYFLQLLIQYYLNTGQIDEALTYLDKAIERNPDVANYYQVKGSIYAYLYEQEGTHRDDAIKTLKKALELDNSLADANYHLGNIYYLQAEKVKDKAGYINYKDTKAIEAAEKQYTEIYKIAIEYFEKAHELNKTDLATLQRLKSLYYMFMQKDSSYEAKYKQVRDEINNL